MAIEPTGNRQLISEEVVSRRAPRSMMVAILAFLVAAAAVYWLVKGSDSSGDSDLNEDSELSDDGDGVAQIEAVDDADLRARIRLTALNDQAAIFDLKLPSGSRLRVSAPAGFADDLVLASVDENLTEVTMIGPGATTIVTRFDFCGAQAGLSRNAEGSDVARTETGAVFCRPDERLSSTVTTDIELSDRDLEQFDIRPINVGPDRSRDGSGSASALFGCPGCGLGPTAFVRNGVVINRTGLTSITAVDEVFLDELWRIDFDGFDVRLYTDPTHVYVDVSGGPFVKLDPGTGSELWRIDRLPGEIATGLGGDPVSSVRLLASAFPGEGSSAAPILRSVDAGSGQVDWIAEGRPEAQWQQGPPALIGDIAVLVDVLDPKNGNRGTRPGGTARAYSMDDGRLMWSSDLDAPPGAFSSSATATAISALDTSYLLVQTANNLVYRLDPETGETLWRNTITNPTIIGVTALADGSSAIKITSSSGTEVLDPTTGERLADASSAEPPNNCVALYGSNPWITLVGDEADDACLIVADFQNFQIWNKSDRVITLRWLDRYGQLPPDNFASTGTIGDFLPFGPTDIESLPYAVPTLWLLGYEQSPTGAMSPGVASYGPIEIGMTIGEAAAALGHTISVDPGVGPSCAVVVGDPYSPLISVNVSVGEEPLIIGLTDPRRGGAKLGRTSGCS